MPAPRNSSLDETIFALSSGRPPAALAIVRISGAGAGPVLARLAGRLPQPRSATLARLRDGRDETLDHALVLWFPGERSATGEDLAELHLHGGIAVVDAVLAELGRTPGLRPAEAGEFTRRALLNGRLDLTEVEGLADLLAAETEAQRREAMLRSEGALGRKLRGWADRLVALCAAVEAAIDYDEEVPDDATSGIAEPLGALHREIEAALASPPAERLKDGVRVAIVGPTNAGKSSLFNALLGQSAAIVSPMAGTTRDLIERPIALGGIPLVLIDTAGLRDAEDLIEQEGIDRARRAADGADILLDLDQAALSGDRVVAVSAKADLRPARGAAIGVSSLTGQGLDTLIAAILARASTLLPRKGEVTLDRRYRSALSDVADQLASAAATTDSVLMAEALRLARVRLDRLIGGADVESVLDALFGRFCLGK